MPLNKENEPIIILFTARLKKTNKIRGTVYNCCLELYIVYEHESKIVHIIW